MAQIIKSVRHVTKNTGLIRCNICSSLRNLCDSGGFSRENYVPGRIRRRLAERNLTVDDLVPRYTANSVDKTNQTHQNTNTSSEFSLQKELEDAFVDKNSVVEFPSDVENFKPIKKETTRRNVVDPQNTSVVLFPGQGSQFVGMGKTLLKYPGVSDLYARASEFLGYDLLTLCLTGPKEKLDMTRYCQPAVFVTSLAALESMKEEHPGYIDSCIATAGYSIGEYTAMVFSGVLPFETAIELVDLRSKVMQESSEAVAGGMMSVYINRETKIRTAMVAAKEYCRKKLHMEEPVCKVANYACTNIQVIAGHEEALDFIQHFGKEWGIRRAKRLPVSGAFHTELMKLSPSYTAFKNLLLRTEFQEPKIPLYSNVTGKRVPPGVQRFKTLLNQHLVKPVMWEQIMHAVYKRPADVPYPKTFEVGPGNQLGAMLKSCNGKAYNQYIGVSG